MTTSPSIRHLALELRLYVANHFITHVPSHTLRLFYYRSVLRFRIGKQSSIFMGTTFESPGKLIIGEGSTVNRGCLLDSRGSLSIGDSVSISSGVTILTAEHDIQSSTFAGREEPVQVEDHVFIGTKALIPARRCSWAGICYCGRCCCDQECCALHGCRRHTRPAAWEPVKRSGLHRFIPAAVALRSICPREEG